MNRNNPSPSKSPVKVVIWWSLKSMSRLDHETETKYKRKERAKIFFSTKTTNKNNLKIIDTHINKKNQKMIDYTKTKIYKIWSHLGDKLYIGSTTKKYLSERMAYHRTDYKSWKKTMQETESVLVIYLKNTGSGIVK
jgi:hypothetical protein